MHLTPMRPPRFSRPRAAAAAAAVLSLLTAAATVAAVAAAPPAGAASTPSAQSLYQAALKAAGGENVHFASSATQDGVSIDVDGDTGSTSGAQTLTVTKGKTVEHVRAMVVGSTGYINGNDTALHNVIGLTTKQAHTYAGKWLSFPTSNTALATLVQGLLTSQVPDELQMGGPFTYGPPTTVDGERAARGPWLRQHRQRFQNRRGPLRAGQRVAAPDRGAHQPRRQELVGHPRQRGLLQVGREDGRDRAGRQHVAAEADTGPDVGRHVDHLDDLD